MAKDDGTMEEVMEYTDNVMKNIPLGYFDDDPNPQNLTHRYYAHCDGCDWFIRGFYPRDVVRIGGDHAARTQHHVRYEWGN